MTTKIFHRFSGDAFMRVLPFYDAFMTCIRTVETSNPSLLANIDPTLVKKKQKL
jgi:hypothetical protein